MSTEYKHPMIWRMAVSLLFIINIALMSIQMQHWDQSKGFTALWFSTMLITIGGYYCNACILQRGRVSQYPDPEKPKHAYVVLKKFIVFLVQAMLMLWNYLLGLVIGIVFINSLVLYYHFPDVYHSNLLYTLYISWTCFVAFFAGPLTFIFKDYKPHP